MHLKNPATGHKICTKQDAQKETTSAQQAHRAAAFWSTGGSHTLSNERMRTAHFTVNATSCNQSRKSSRCENNVPINFAIFLNAVNQQLPTQTHK